MTIEVRGVLAQDAEARVVGSGGLSVVILLVISPPGFPVEAPLPAADMIAAQRAADGLPRGADVMLRFGGLTPRFDHGIAALVANHLLSVLVNDVPVLCNRT